MWCHQVSKAAAPDFIRPPERTKPLPNMNSNLAHRVLCRYGAEWSGRWCLDEPGETTLRLRNVHTHAISFVRVEVTLRGSTVFATMRMEPGPPFLHPPFRIENLTLETVQYRQSGA